MSARTLALWVLLLSVSSAAGIFWWQRSITTDAAPQPAETIQATDDEPRHARIDDSARILAPFGPRLGRMADAFNDDIGIDVHVVTRVDGATPIETQAVELFERRKVAREAPTGGILIVLDPKLRAARIEVGYSLEAVMTDLQMGRLARDQLAPYASYGAAGMAVMDVLHHLRDRALFAAARGELALPDQFRNTPDYLRYQRFLSGGAGSQTRLDAQPIDADLKAPVPADRRAKYAPGATPQESVAALQRVMRDLAGDPTLELFTEGSRLMRRHYPVAPFEEWQREELIARSQPLDYRIKGDLAVASSLRPASGFVPVLLRRQGGLWRVDLVETWKNLFFDPQGDYFLRNSNTPYAFGLAEFGRGGHHDIDALKLISGTIEGDLALLEGRNDPLSALRRGELWLRNAFVFPPALQAYEAALKAAPEDPLILEVFGSRAQYLGFPELAIPALEKIGRGLEFTLATAYDEMNDLDGAQRWVDAALEENPYEPTALEWQEHLARRRGNEQDLKRAQAESARLRNRPGQAFKPVVLHFEPANPRYEADTTVNIGGTEVHDHGHFGVTIHNTSAREVEIERVHLTSLGTARASGLGDIKNYWTYEAGKNRLRAGEWRYFEKEWGFVVDTGHLHVRYVFHVCWHGVDDMPRVRQCRTQWLDMLP
jgi:tetratricopeptide (TPR) repeat protein